MTSAAVDSARRTVWSASLSEMNVTPMLDVLLVLLVIFLIASARMHHTMDVLLPVSCAGVCESDTVPIVLEVLPGPTFRVNQRAVA
jgi:biopolymer transport protein TolR